MIFLIHIQLIFYFNKFLISCFFDSLLAEKRIFCFIFFACFTVPSTSLQYTFIFQKCFSLVTLTAYHHFEYDCKLVYFCNNTQIYYYCYSAGTIRHPNSWDRKDLNIVIEPTWLRRYYIQISTVCNALFVSNILN